MGWGPGLAKGDQNFQNMSSLWRHLQKTPTENKKLFFFDVNWKTCWICKGFEQLSSSSGWQFMTKKGPANRSRYRVNVKKLVQKYKLASLLQ